MLDHGKATKIKAMGKEWTLSRLELHIIEAYRDWIAEQVDVQKLFDRAERFADKLPAIAAKEYEEAKEIEKQLECFSLSCPLAKRFLTPDDPKSASLAGVVKFYHLLLQEHHPDLTPVDVQAIILAAGKQLAPAVAKAEGKVPEVAGASGNVEAPAA